MGNEYSIGGIQQVGVGVEDINQRWDEIRKCFGFDTVIFRERAHAKLMTHYTNGTVEEREAMLALNLYGGGGFEIWQYVSRTPSKNEKRILPGSLGIYAVRLQTADVAAAHSYLEQSRVISCAPLRHTEIGAPYFFCRDLDENLFQIAEGRETLYRNLHPIGGVAGVIIGCSNIEASLPLYRDLLCYDRVVSDTTRTFTSNSFFLQPCVTDGPAPPTTLDNSMTVRIVLLQRSEKGAGSPFSEFYGQSTIELWQLLPNGAPAESHSLHGRQWGDVGFIHLCFEVTGMDALKQAAQKMGIRFTVDSGDAFGIGGASGRFAYIEDADGTLIEFVETHRIQLLKIPPISFNAKKHTKPISPKLLKALILKRTQAPRQ